LKFTPARNQNAAWRTIEHGGTYAAIQPADDRILLAMADDDKVRTDFAGT
jgi:hypothetical protein